METKTPKTTRLAHPKKSLGQNFLTNLGVVSKIIDAGDICADDVVLEIGPGKGVLTERLLALARKVIAVEKDDALVAHLREKFAAAIREGRFDLVHGDILRFDETQLSFYKHPYKLIANIPYNITGAILEKFLSSPLQPERAVLLVQKEVGERIVAHSQPRRSDKARDKESLLSISVKVYGVPALLAKVSAGSFFPKPKVDTAIISISKISRHFFTEQGIEEGAFFAFLRAGFAHKRKLLGGNLRGYFPTQETWEKAAAKAGINPKSRPENLATINWRALFLENIQNGLL